MTLDELLKRLEEMKREVITFADGRKGVRVEGAFEIKASKDNENLIEMIGSDETVDRYGEVVSVDGWDLTNYRKNPVVLLGHNYDQVVGRAREVAVKEIGGKRRLWFQIEFPTKEISELGWQIGQLYRHGYMKASSVGFIPLDWKMPEGDQAKAGENAPRLVYTKQELLELSMVAVPANPSAVMLHLEAARKAGSLSPDGLAAVAKGLGLKAEEPAPAPEDPQAKAAEVMAKAVGDALKAELAPHIAALGEIKDMLKELLLTTDPVEPTEPSKGAPAPQLPDSTGLYDGLLRQVQGLRQEARTQTTKGGGK